MSLARRRAADDRQLIVLTWPTGAGGCRPRAAEGGAIISFCHPQIKHAHKEAHATERSPT